MLSDNQTYFDIDLLSAEIEKDLNGFIIIRAFEIQELMDLLNARLDSTSVKIEKCTRELNSELNVTILKTLNRKSMNSVRKPIYLVRTDAHLDNEMVSPQEREQYLPFVSVIFKSKWNTDTHLKRVERERNLIMERGLRITPDIDFLIDFYFTDILQWKEIASARQTIANNIKYLASHTPFNEPVRKRLIDFANSLKGFRFLSLRNLMDVIMQNHYPKKDQFKSEFAQEDLLKLAIDKEDRNRIKNEMPSQMRFGTFINSKYWHIRDACNMNIHGQVDEFDSHVIDTLLLDFVNVLRFISNDLIQKAQPKGQNRGS